MKIGDIRRMRTYDKEDNLISGPEYAGTECEDKRDDVSCDERPIPCSMEKIEKASFSPNKYAQGFSQWLVEGDKFIPVGETVKKIPSGFYSFHYHSRLDKMIPRKERVNIDNLLILPDPTLTRVLKDIRSFWKKQGKYDEYDYVYKRGILLYGSAGCGKSCVIMLLTHELIEKYDGIVLNLKHSDDLYHFENVLKDIQEIEPDRKIIVIMEDIDNFVNSSDKGLLTKLLNILDGSLQCKNLVILATTNFPEKLQARISHRPSRFDRRYEVGLPSPEVRKFYTENKLKKDDLKKLNVDDLIKKTEGFTIDHLKELLLSVYVLGYDFDEAYKEVKEMTDSKRVLRNTNQGSIGFGEK